MSPVSASGRALAALAGVVLAGVVVGCAPSTGPDGQGDLDGSSSSGSLVAFDSLEAVVTWSDTVGTFEVTDVRERQLPSGEGLPQRTERSVTVRLSDTIWSRPGSPQPPASFTFSTITYDHGSESGDEDGGVRFEAGPLYVAPVFHAYGEWGLLGEWSFPADDGRVTPEADQDSDLAASIDGMDADQLRAVLEATEPDPEVDVDLRLTIDGQFEALGHAPFG